MTRLKIFTLIVILQATGTTHGMFRRIMHQAIRPCVITAVSTYYSLCKSEKLQTVPADSRRWPAPSSVISMPTKIAQPTIDTVLGYSAMFSLKRGTKINFQGLTFTIGRFYIDTATRKELLQITCESPSRDYLLKGTSPLPISSSMYRAYQQNRSLFDMTLTFFIDEEGRCYEQAYQKSFTTGPTGTVTTTKMPFQINDPQQHAYWLRCSTDLYEISRAGIKRITRAHGGEY